MKRKWKVGLVALCAVILCTVIYAAAAGSESDPLITLGYLKNIFTPQITATVDEAVAAGQEQNKSDLDAAIADWDAQVSEAVKNAGNNSSSSSAPATFASVSMAEGKSMTVQAGCEIIVRSGSPVCSGDLIDQTDGTTLKAGSALKANHLYLASAQCKVSVPTSTVTGVVNAGPLNVRAGAGTGYSILGTLQEGVTVTVVDSSNSSWYMITSGGLAGYVSAAYITLNSSVVSGPAGLMLRGSYSVE